MLEMAFTIKYIGKSFYYRNALERGFYYRNALEKDFNIVAICWKELLL